VRLANDFLASAWAGITSRKKTRFRRPNQSLSLTAHPYLPCTASRLAGLTYFPPFLLLSSLQSIWQLAAIAFPPSCHGLMWSASISLTSNFFLEVQRTHCRDSAPRSVHTVEQF
jgi:hypothetical protein